MDKMTNLTMPIIEAKTYYDVCNDYSLDKREKPSDLYLYKWHKSSLDGVNIEIGTHKKHDEIHYIRTESTENLNNWYL